MVCDLVEHKAYEYAWGRGVLNIRTLSSRRGFCMHRL